MKAMRSTFILLIGLIFASQSHAQCGRTSIQTLQANQVKAFFSNVGDLFSDGEFNGGFAAPYVPGFPEVHTLLHGSLVLSGIDPSGAVRTSSVGYRTDASDTDFIFGPLDDQTGQPIADGCANFAHIWQVYRDDLLRFLADYDDNGQIDQAIPAHIKSWPGRGNPLFEQAMGFELPDQELAPFFDRNENGIYEPTAGEYPVIGPDMPDAIPDHLIWAVFNDVANTHLFLDSESIGAEVHLMAYGFNCGDHETLSQTIFTRHKIFLKGVDPINNFTTGFWIDPDLGCHSDDYIGTDSISNSVYIYNQDAVDGEFGCECPGNILTYCEQPPVQAITILNEPLWRSMAFFPSSVNVPPAIMRPQTAEEYYSYLQGNWRDGTPLTVGGFGYNPAGMQTTTHFAYFDDPSNLNGWSMFAEDQPSYGALPVFAAPPRSLSQGESMIVDIAYSFHRQAGASNIENVQVMRTQIPDIQNAFDNAFDAVCAQSVICESDCVWPGDADNSGSVDKDDILMVGVGAGHAALGPNRSPANYHWAPQSASEWTENFIDGSNYKYADTNGDGMISPEDAFLIDQHYDLAIPGFTAPDDVPVEDAPVVLCLENSKDSLSAATNFELARLLQTSLILGTEEQPVSGLYGISFTLVYDTTLMTIPVTFPVYIGSFTDLMGTEEQTVFITKTNSKAGRIDFSVCRTNGLEINGWGRLGTISLLLRNDAVTGNPDLTRSIVYQIVNLKAIDFEENLLEIGAKSDTTQATNLMFDPTITSTEDELNKGSLRLSPNPNQGTLFLELIHPKRDEEVEFQLINLQSQVLMSQKLLFSGSGLQVDLSPGLNNGLYLVVLSTEDGRQFVHKVVVER